VFSSATSKFTRPGLFRKFGLRPKVSPVGHKLRRLPMSGPALGIVARHPTDSLLNIDGRAIQPLETPALSVSEMPVFPALLITVNGVPTAAALHLKAPSRRESHFSTGTAVPFGRGAGSLRFALLNQSMKLRGNSSAQLIHVADCG